MLWNYMNWMENLMLKLLKPLILIILELEHMSSNMEHSWDHFKEDIGLDFFKYKSQTKPKILWKNIMYYKFLNMQQGAQMFVLE